jgi:hypothetical protein
MKKILIINLLFFLSFIGFAQNPKIYIAFLWHMHQPIYWPGEDVVQTANAGHYGYNLWDIFISRTGPYTDWPKNAVIKGIDAGFGNFGSQVSFSGSLIENLNRLESHGVGNFSNWKSHWNYIKMQNTSLGNPRMDMVAFGYYHPLMPLIDNTSIIKQIQLHKTAFANNFSGSYSKGMFPPENAFALHIIPALKSENINWVMVDNIHFDRTCEGYPFNTGGNLYEPNQADILNPNPNDWKQLNNLWAPTPVSAAWGHRPHYAIYINPNTGTEHKIIVVPTSRYLGNEDGMGGFGALQYESVMSQLESYNTDPNHPILIVLHHDGDNYGGGSDSYYNHNFNNFVAWLQSNPNRFVCTTVEDYLEMFPPNPNDIIHIEPGSWSGADNGDPQFRKWLGPPNSQGYSPDRNSWSIITAATNIVKTAEQINPSSQNVQNAWKYLLLGQTSCYWYWDYAENGVWDSHPTRAANMAVAQVNSIVQGQNETMGPEIFLPQRHPYNPGGKEFNVQQTSDVTIWTYVYDFSGLSRVHLKYRIDNDGVNSMFTNHNETYTGGSDVGQWQTINMTGINIPSQTNPQPTYKAQEFSAVITGLNNFLIDYYVEAEDTKGNVSRSIIQHVWIGQASSGTQTGITWSPANPNLNDIITITVNDASFGGKLHWGVNGWTQPIQEYWPENSYLFNSTGPAVQSPMNGPANNKLTIQIGPFNNPQQIVNTVNFVINYDNNSWDNNNGNDYHITISQSSGDNLFEINFDELTNASLFPNPVEDKFFILLSAKKECSYPFKIIDITGKTLKEFYISNNIAEQDISELKQGLYFILIYSPNDAKLITLKLIKE